MGRIPEDVAIAKEKAGFLSAACVKNENRRLGPAVRE